MGSDEWVIGVKPLRRRSLEWPRLLGKSELRVGFTDAHVEAYLLIGDTGAWHGADLFLRPEPAMLNPQPNRRRRWLVVSVSYVACDSSPPAMLVVAEPDRNSVAI